MNNNRAMAVYINSNDTFVASHHDNIQEMYIVRNNKFLCRFKDDTFKSDKGEKISDEDIALFMNAKYYIDILINNIWK